MMMLGCEDFLSELIDSEGVIAVSIISLVATTGVIAILAGTVLSAIKTRAKEATRRELAAYVAEGSLRPEDAVALMDAGAIPEDEVGG